MNAKEAKNLRRQARDCFAVRDEADRKPKDSYVVHRKGIREVPTGKNDEKGEPVVHKLTVFSLANHPDSLRGIYRNFKKLAKGGRS